MMVVVVVVDDGGVPVIRCAGGRYEENIERERERKGEVNPTESARERRRRRDRTCARSALPPFVEKGRRNYVVAQLMRPRGTIIW